MYLLVECTFTTGPVIMSSINEISSCQKLDKKTLFVQFAIENCKSYVDKPKKVGKKQKIFSLSHKY